MNRTFSLIWIAAFALAAGCVQLLRSDFLGTEKQFLNDLPSVVTADIVFIGSSLTRNAFPANEPVNGILGDGRPCTILSVGGIDESHSNILLAYAINSGAKTIFIEINQYAHDYVGLREPPITSSIVVEMREAGERITTNAKALLGSGLGRRSWAFRKLAKIGRCSGVKPDQTLDTQRLSPKDFYRLHKIEPSRANELRVLLQKARDSKTEVFFFWPPRPESASSAIGSDEFADVQAYVAGVAASFGVPLWYSTTAWPDDQFMDILAHTNERGRIRFQQELAQWYGTRP